MARETPFGAEKKSLISQVAHRTTMPACGGGVWRTGMGTERGGGVGGGGGWARMLVVDEDEEGKKVKKIEVPVTPTENVRRMRRLVGRKARVEVTDGRTFFGDLTCYDKDGNTLLRDAREVRVDKAGKEHNRIVGLALIPLRHTVRFDVEVRPNEGPLLQPVPHNTPAAPDNKAVHEESAAEAAAAPDALEGIL